MRCFRLMIGLVCLAGLAGCDEFDPTLAVREAVAAPAPWGAVTAFLNADSDKAEYRADHRDGHTSGGGGGSRGTGGPRGRGRRYCPCR